jgi:hypothetical protein
MTTCEHTPSKREVLFMATALAALPATTPAAAALHPDAELLQLNAELEQRWQTAWNLYGPAIVAVEQAEEEISGRTGGRWPGAITSNEEWLEWCRVVNEVRERSGAEAINAANDAAWEALDTIVLKILDTPVATLVGLAVKGRAVACVHHELWRDPDVADLDWDKQVMRQLLEQLIAAGGLALPANIIEA